MDRQISSLDDVLHQAVDIEHVDLRTVVLPQHEVFRSAVGERRERRALIVTVRDRDGRFGIGECSCRPDPFYSGEFVDGAAMVVERFLVPLLASATTLAEVERAVGRVRGWPFTVGAVLDACCDLLRRAGGADPVDLLPVRTERIPVGISLGLFPDAESAIRRLETEVAAGYRRIKLKLSPDVPLDQWRAIRSAFPELALGFDANGSLDGSHMDLLVGLEALDPHMIEQPFAPDRWDLLVELRRRAPRLRLCLDESIKGLGGLRLAHESGVIDELNLKPGRVGGPLETYRLLVDCERRELPVWIGGMFETSIGRRANLRVAARIADAVGHDLSPSSRYFPRDLVLPPVAMHEDGTVSLDDSPVRLDEASLDDLTVDSKQLSIPRPASAGGAP